MFARKSWTGDFNLGVPSTELVFSVLRLDEIPGWECGEKRSKGSQTERWGTPAFSLTLKW